MFDRLFGKMAPPDRTMGAEEGDRLPLGQVFEEGMNRCGYAVGLDGESDENDVVAPAALDVPNRQELFLEMDRIIDGAGKFLSVARLGVICNKSLHSVHASFEIFAELLAHYSVHCKGQRFFSAMKNERCGRWAGWA